MSKSLAFERTMGGRGASGSEYCVAVGAGSAIGTDMCAKTVGRHFGRSPRRDAIFGVGAIGLGRCVSETGERSGAGGGGLIHGEPSFNATALISTFGSASPVGPRLSKGEAEAVLHGDTVADRDDGESTSAMGTARELGADESA